MNWILCRIIFTINNKKIQSLYFLPLLLLLVYLLSPHSASLQYAWYVSTDGWAPRYHHSFISNLSLPPTLIVQLYLICKLPSSAYLRHYPIDFFWLRSTIASITFLSWNNFIASNMCSLPNQYGILPCPLGPYTYSSSYILSTKPILLIALLSFTVCSRIEVEKSLLVKRSCSWNHGKPKVHEVPDI